MAKGDVEIVAGGVDDLQEFVHAWAKVWPSRPRVYAEMVRDFTELDEKDRALIWLARKDGATVGYAETYRILGAANAWNIEVGVMPEERGQGLGETLYQTVTNRLSSELPGEWFGRISEDDQASRAFAEKRGFEERKREFESQLDPQSVPDGLLESWSAPIPGVEVVPMAERDSPRFRRSLLALLEIIRIDVPRTTPPEPIDFDFFDRHIVGDPAFRWDGSFVAEASGELVGMSANYEGDGPEFLDQWITGVKREWRRKGVAQSLKAHNVRWAKANGVCTIRTSNESNNLSMRAINERLGFVRKVGVVIMGRRPKFREFTPKNR